MKKHVCLGIRKQGDTQYLDVLNSEHLSTTTDLSDAEQLELVPLLSKSASEYSAIEPGTEYPPSDSDYKPSGQFNFGSVFRVSAAINGSSWVYENTDLPKSNAWWNYGHLGVGPITTQSGEKYDDQLLAVKTNGTLARSPDGIHWFFDMGKVSDEVSGWTTGLVYGNGIWCVVSGGTHTARYSTDGGQTWNDSDLTSGCYCLAFDHGVFMTVAHENA